MYWQVPSPLIGLIEQATLAFDDAGQFTQLVPHAEVLFFATHWLLQKFWPVGHWQTELTHERPLVHTMPGHPPQWLLSVEKLTH